MSNYHNKNYQPTVLEVIFVGIIKALWWLVRLPFRKGKGRSGGFNLEAKNEIILKRQEIESLSKSENQIELKHAVMEADKLVDHILKLKGYSGETFADRLKSGETYINPAIYQQIWHGHKVRNQIAHEQGLKITTFELKTAIEKLVSYIRTI